MVLSIIGLHACGPKETSPKTIPQDLSDRVSLGELLDVCAPQDLLSRQSFANLNPIYEDIEDADIIPIPSNAYFDALKNLDGNASKKVENTKIFGVDVGQRGGQPYLVRACLDYDPRKFLLPSYRSGLQNRLKNYKLGWHITQNHDILIYNQFRMGRKTDKLYPAIFIVWSEEEIEAVQGSVLYVQ